jgi:hypothetical protein
LTARQKVNSRDTHGSRCGHHYIGSHPTRFAHEAGPLRNHDARLQTPRNDRLVRCLEYVGWKSDRIQLLAEPGRTLVSHLTQQRIRGGSFHAVKELVTAIKDYIDNQKPQVFVWSAPVDRILSKIAKCKEALDAVH